MTQIDREIKENELVIAEYKTNHILHLLLSIFSGGLWLVVWLIVAMVNDGKRATARHNIRNLVNLAT